MRLLLLFILIWQPGAGQGSICYNYTIYDPCPDPKKHRIASRTIYTTRTNEMSPCVDTTFEKYDHYGNLFSLEYFNSSPNKLQTQHIQHHFLYDDQQRIVQERHTGDVVISYEYSTNGDTVRITNPAAYISNGVVHSVIWHNRVQGDTNAIGIDSNGDTIYRMKATRLQRTEKSFLRNMDGIMKVVDSSVTYVRPDMRYTFNFHADLNGETWTTIYISRLDKKQRVTQKEYLAEHNFRKNVTYFECDRKGRLERTNTTTYPLRYPIADNDTSVWETKYYYNSNGKLTQTQSWNHNQPNLIELTSYIFNEKELLTEIHRIQLDCGRVIEEEREHWIYTYY